MAETYLVHHTCMRIIIIIIITVGTENYHIILRISLFLFVHHAKRTLPKDQTPARPRHDYDRAIHALYARHMHIIIIIIVVIILYG